MTFVCFLNDTKRWWWLHDAWLYSLSKLMAEQWVLSSIFDLKALFVVIVDTNKYQNLMRRGWPVFFVDCPMTDMNSYSPGCVYDDYV